MHHNDKAAPAVAPEQGASVAEELAYRLRQQRLAAEYGHFALRTHDTAALLQEATRVCALGLHSEFCKVMRFLPDEGRFLMVAGVGWKPGFVGHAHAGADLESPAGYAFQTGEPVISNHLEGETRFRTPDILVEHGVRRAINVLIRGEDTRYGVLEVDSPTEGRFTEADLAFMQGFANLLGVAIERQQAEESLRASQAETRASETLLQGALAHQEVLTREINHRVKNSLSIVAGLLSMQGRAAANPDLRQALDGARARVQTIASVHDRLWRTDEIHAVNLAEFMGELCEQLRSSARPGQTLTCDFAPTTVATDQAVPLGLMANELVTNAFKYAYPEGEGDVRISVVPRGEGQLRMTVCDRGKGLPPDFDTSRSRSLGMKLIATLGRQLGGQPAWECADPGTRFVLDFRPLHAADREG
ncbi:sensor histidine kinase [Methylorubrum extorquens]|uniref:histidine kinase n=1 Tax=Methylorubrum extorquens (strain CM4 / NCIMB 13688) TaxID=440085 RepID=B7L1Q5_METC4|nr:histidine kinase dimerization/phosphoacceptor domain -containing protein [Methylorubrum extorquens]ACK81449.1 signal transduction histidine kinase [Methylorubrum extorquens CM4]